MLELWVNGLDDSDRLSGYDVVLEFDPSVLSVEDVSGGPGPVDASPAFTIDNENGRVSLSTDQIRARVIEDALMARISVRSLGPVNANSDLRISAFELVDHAGRKIPVASTANSKAAIANAAVTVGTAAVRQGSATSIPVRIMFAPRGGVAGYNISVRYDPSAITINGISPGEAPFSGTPIFNLDEKNATINIVGFHGERPGPTGSIIALNIEVSGVLRGSTPLEIIVKDLVDATGAASWPAVPVNGAVRVISRSAGMPERPGPPPFKLNTASDGQSALEGAVISDIAPLTSTVVSLPGEQVVLTIPAGAVKETGFVALRDFKGGAKPQAPLDSELGATFEVNFLDPEGSLLTDLVLLQQAELRMGFTQSQIDTWGTGGILIQRYEPVLGRWLPLSTTVDPDGLAATAVTNRFSVFGMTFTKTDSGDPGGPGKEPLAAETGPSDSPVGPAGPASREESSGQDDLVLVILLAVVLAVVILGGLGLILKR